MHQLFPLQDKAWSLNYLSYGTQASFTGDQIVIFCTLTIILVIRFFLISVLFLSVDAERLGLPILRFGNKQIVFEVHFSEHPNQMIAIRLQMSLEFRKHIFKTFDDGNFNL